MLTNVTARAVGLLPRHRATLSEARKAPQAIGPADAVRCPGCGGLTDVLREAGEACCPRCGLVSAVYRDSREFSLANAELLLRAVCGPLGPSESYCSSPWLAEQRDAIYRRFSELKLETDPFAAGLQARAEWLAAVLDGGRTEK